MVTPAGSTSVAAINRLIGRIASFFGQSVYAQYGGQIKRKKPIFGIIYFLVSFLCVFPVGNFLALCVLMLFYDNYRLPPRSGTFFQFGLSKNNERVFDRLNSCLEPASVSELVSVNGREIRGRERLGLLLGVRALWMCAQLLTRSRNIDPFVQVQQILGCSALLLFSKYLDRYRPILVCIANDHSPVCMALIAASKAIGVRTVYIQHAPVTRYFPPLEYDLSILFDEVSREVYRAIASLHRVDIGGEVVLLSPFESEFGGIESPTFPLSVGVCLSLMPRIDDVERMVVELTSMPFVENVYVRKHPRDTGGYPALNGQRKVAVQEAGLSQSDFFDKVDIVLIPNSGIAVEALHCGKPSFYTPGLDSFGYDYYGFVAAGILPLYEIAAISSREGIILHFDESWRRRYENYDETARCGQVEMKRNVQLAIDKLLME